MMRGDLVTEEKKKKTNQQQKNINKFFTRHGLVVMKYGSTLLEMRLGIQA